MGLSIGIAGLHYWALAIGFCSIVLRYASLRESTRSRETSKILKADNWWGIAALLWIVTGLMRVFGSFDKGSTFYFQSHWFYLKMTLFLLVFVLELYPMVTFIKWRIAKKTQILDSELKQILLFQRLSAIQIAITLLIPFVAVCLSRDIRF